MTTQHNLVISKLPLVLDSTHRTYTVNDKAIRFGGLLESLLTVP